MSTSQKPSSSPMAALSSENYLCSVLQILGDRESKRHAARFASRMHVLTQSNLSSTKRNQQLALLSLSRGIRDTPPIHIEHYAVTAGCCATYLNRYLDIIPYDRTRVVVYDGSVGHGEQINQMQGRYLNASWVLEREGHKWWIASQAPLEQSTHAFLSILLQSSMDPPNSSSSFLSRVRTVVQLTRDIEGGRRKADPYFPSEVGMSIIVPHDEGHRTPALKVTLSEKRLIEEAHCIESTVSVVPIAGQVTQGQTRNINVEKDGQAVVFKHLHFLHWPDHGVPKPEEYCGLVAFIRFVDQTNRDTSLFSTSANLDTTDIDPDPPIIVGCSAGIGRTGTFIALSSLLRKYGFLQPAVRPTPATVLPPSALGPLPEQLQMDEIAQEVDSLREQRPGMVERREQLLLIYEVLAQVSSLSTQ